MYVRPLYKHRPPQSRASGRTRRAGGVVALAALLLLGASSGACKGGSSPGGSVTSGASPQTAASLTAGGLVPSLDDLGYKLTQQGKEPAAIGGLDSALALYTKQSSAQSVQLRIYVYPDEASAEKQWAATAEAFRNPPPDVLGTASKNIDAVSPSVGQLQKSYVTDKPDGSGNLVWTDIYRQGRVVLLTQVLDSAKSDGMAVRKPVAERVLGKAR